MGRFKITLLTILTFVLTLVATVGAASACTWMHYQPEPPKDI